MKELVVVIAGVTGAGKTDLSLELSEQLPIEIINADSVSIYRELNIGSAKASVEQRQDVIHHLIDDLDIEEPFNVALFQKLGRDKIEKIMSRGHIPVIVGGTGLYINALINDYEFKEETDIPYEDKRTNEELLKIIKEIEPNTPLHINNRVRLIREVQRIERGSVLETKRGDSALYNAKIYFLQGDREQLYNNINNRVDAMFDLGLVEEVEYLLKKYPNFFELSSTNAIGYREFKEYFLGNTDLETVKDLIKRNTRRFAKRQITWFKNKTNSQWIDIEDVGYKQKIINEIKTAIENEDDICI